VSGSRKTISLFLRSEHVIFVTNYTGRKNENQAMPFCAKYCHVNTHNTLLKQARKVDHL